VQLRWKEMGRSRGSRLVAFDWSQCHRSTMNCAQLCSPVGSPVPLD
jgi:hypothetical protein